VAQRSALSAARPSIAPGAAAPIALPDGTWLGRARSWCVAHPDLAAVLPILALALLIRVALLYRIPPLFMPGDSQSFLTPAYDLARGLGFDPILKRPLGYPLLISFVITSFGEDLRALIFVQVMLGLVTVAATYCLGRLTFGRATGIVAALMVAIGGQLLIYEHFILAESVFGMLLALAMLGLVVATRGGQGTVRAAILGGVGLAAASLFRPIAEVVLPIVPLYFLATIRPVRRSLALAGLVVVGFLALMVPATIGDVMLRGGISSGALGEHLLWRITRSDSGYISREDARRADADPNESAARRFVIRRAADRTLPQEIFVGLERDLGLGAGEADTVMRGVALQAIARQPARYLTSTLSMSASLFLGDDQPLGEVSKRDGDRGYANPQAKQRTWFEDRVLHLGAPPDPTVENEFDNAEALTSLYQPMRVRWLIVLGYVAGTVLAALGRPNRLGLILALGIPPMLLANAALAGPEARFRYPIDPLIGVLVAGGLVGIVQPLVGRFGRRAAGRAD
jgi:hypothetical protein